MLVNFSELFDATKQKQIADAILKQAQEEHWCCTCKHCKSERDGEWCTFLNTCAENTCLFYELED